MVCVKFDRFYNIYFENVVCLWYKYSSVKDVVAGIEVIYLTSTRTENFHLLNCGKPHNEQCE